MQIYIYKITVNEKYYIGISNDPDRRLRNHKYSDTYIGCAIRKYGVDDFEIIDQTELYEIAFELEKKHIKKFNTLVPNGYNLTEGGENPPSWEGKQHSEKTKKKISESNKGKHHLSLEQRKKLRDSHTPESYVKLSAAKKGKKNPKLSIICKGKKHSPETIAKMRIQHKGENNSFYGKHHSRESKTKISIACKKHWENKKKDNVVLCGV